MVNTKLTNIPSSTSSSSTSSPSPSSSTAARMDSNGNAITRMHSSMKRPRAPIACIRCHHKKVRCDGEHPNCARCTQGGVLCAYPSSRRSRNTQSTSVDPFIDNLSQLEFKIQQIEADLESQRSLFLSYQVMPSNHQRLGPSQMYADAIPLDLPMKRTDKAALEGRLSVAQARLHKDPQRQSKRSTAIDTKKRSFPQGSQPTSHKKLKQGHQKKMAGMPKIKTPSISLSSLSSSPSSASTESSQAPTSNVVHNTSIPQSNHSQSYLFPALDPFSCHSDWTNFPPYPSSYAKETPSYAPFSQPYANFTPQQPSPLTTPDYTDDGSDQLHLLSSTSSANDPAYRHPSSYPYTHPAINPPSQQPNSCQIMDLYNNFSMDDLISFDSQNPSTAPIMDNNIVWYC